MAPGFDDISDTRQRVQALAEFSRPGKHIEPLAKGIYLVRIGDTVEKILVK